MRGFTVCIPFHHRVLVWYCIGTRLSGGTRYLRMLSGLADCLDLQAWPAADLVRSYKAMNAHNIFLYRVHYKTAFP